MGRKSSAIDGWTPALGTVVLDLEVTQRGERAAVEDGGGGSWPSNRSSSRGSHGLGAYLKELISMLLKAGNCSR